MELCSTIELHPIKRKTGLEPATSTLRLVDDINILAVAIYVIADASFCQFLSLRVDCNFTPL